MKYSTVYAILIGASSCVVGYLADAQSYTTLYSFCAGSCNKRGSDPAADGLVQGTDGNLYGTTLTGGGADEGMAFKITPTGTLTVLHNFCHLDGCADGDVPLSGLVLANSADLYGVTTFGGAAEFGGTVFKITSIGRVTTLYSFCVQSGCPDGTNPGAALIKAEDGNLYGTTASGGANAHGTAFKITPGGTLTTLHSFCAESGCVDGGNPVGALVQARDGSLYGSTGTGGANNGGIVFKMSKQGIVTTVYAFCSTRKCHDGKQPQAALIQATNGDLYGTTAAGGTYNGGTVFKIAPSSGRFTKLYSFCAQMELRCPDGYSPIGALVQATDGNLFGTTESGGANDLGTIFKTTLDGVLTTLYNSNENSFGGTMVQATDGILYGTTLYGGAHGGGSVFSLSVGLGPFVKALPTFGKAGADVTILGTNLTGATSVSFNGMPADLTVISASEIKTVVPAGATTGVVEVATPSGILSSNVVFHVNE